MECRYRQKFRKGSVTLNGAFAVDEISNEKVDFTKIEGEFELKYGFQLDLDVGQVSDSLFLEEYGYSYASDFNSQITLNRT